MNKSEKYTKTNFILNDDEEKRIIINEAKSINATILELGRKKYKILLNDGGYDITLWASSCPKDFLAGSIESYYGSDEAGKDKKIICDPELVDLQKMEASLYIGNRLYDWEQDIKLKSLRTFEQKLNRDRNFLTCIKVDNYVKKMERDLKILPKRRKYFGTWIENTMKEERKKDSEGDERLKKLISDISYGRVLDAMSGVRTRFEASDKIKDIVTLDFCALSLERHKSPSNTKILYDLEEIEKGKHIPFKDSTFQTIGLFYGIDYIKDLSLVPLLKEFHRILSPNGKLITVGSPIAYKDLKRREFDPILYSNNMKSVGFSTKIEDITKEIYTFDELLNFDIRPTTFLIEAVKEEPKCKNKSFLGEGLYKSKELFFNGDRTLFH